MASSAILHGKLLEKKWKHWDRLYFLGLQNHCGWCSHKIKRCLLLGRKAMTNLDSILKSRDITLLTKVSILKAMIFPVIMYGCESWTINKAEHWGINAFKLWCWRRVLRVFWTARRSNQSILKKLTLNIHWKDWCWNWSSNTSATWCKELIHGKRSWCWEKLRARGEGGNRGWDVRMASLTQWTWIWANSGRQQRTGKSGMLQSTGSQRVRHNLASEQQQQLSKVVTSVYGESVPAQTPQLW